MDCRNYQGNAIFRNQPNHSYFDKPFEDEEDCLFQFLNDIEPHFLKPQQQADNLNVTNFAVMDPRTQKPITQLYYDHSQEEKTKIFYSPKKSTMTEKQHELGVQVLNTLQKCLEVREEDMYNWHRFEKNRLKEAEHFQKFVFEFSQNSKEQMYAPCRKLFELYKKWYKSKAIKLVKRYPQESYNTHLGLPQVWQCKNVLNEQQVQIMGREIISKLGKKCIWQDNIVQEFKKFNYSVASYAEAYINSEDVKDILEDNLQRQFVKMVELENEENPIFYMPLESLLFLLTSGDSTDMPTEVLLNIKETKNSGNCCKKYIIMDLPFPSRQGGWYTYQQMVEQAAKAMFSIKQSEVNEKQNPQSKFILNKSTRFEVYTLEDFMQKTTLTADKLCKFSKTLIKWQLGIPNDNTPLIIYTSLESLTEKSDFLLKLEYKPKFGCEVLTKYDLLKEWFKLNLLQTAKSTCLRLDATNYQTLVEEPLTMRKLEKNLLSYYQINCKKLLNNLFEFLKMLYNMPTGHYMLRYNPKFKDKLLLCKPSQEITQNTIHLHQMLQTEVIDVPFISQQNYLPIDENVCSLMHLQHNILPAAFCPRVLKRKLDDRPVFTSKPKKPRVQPKEPKKYNKFNKSRLQMKRARRRQRLYAAFKAKKDEQKELENEMELDRKMLNFL